MMTNLVKSRDLGLGERLLFLSLNGLGHGPHGYAVS